MAKSNIKKIYHDFIHTFPVIFLFFLAFTGFDLSFFLFENNYYYFKKHLNMYDEYTELKKKDYNLENLIYENNFYKSENKRLKMETLFIPQE